MSSCATCPDDRGKRLATSLEGKCLYQSAVVLSGCMGTLGKASVSLTELQNQILQSDGDLPQVMLLLFLA